MKNLLLYRLIVFNACGAAFIVWAWMLGYIEPLFATDISYLSYATAALFAGCLVSTFLRGASINSALNDVGGRQHAVAFLRREAAKMEHKNSHIYQAAGYMQILGLLGTVIGFYVTLGGLEISDQSAVVSGLKTAIGTTIIGGVLSLMTYANALMLDVAAACYVEDIR